ncbi:Crp/Fnr family transcriptional regulator [Sphingobacterium alkalisoli]|uniref:Crp/Fnr family transcriptional regulator n=1 Tax=Sphingobacterium alkalisoli TaxID=1874115 RepID=A0A4U0GU96_9SPHI|nr:Crp/Fnr family transcriptional regulator [Sphingobacterium alkalisoli]TJY62563.1 Crp/Fnr family transcriptional regulator [Sphingobacterium alkalisoli]GGH27456.1 cAMP-binding protein [Sphingobacterium alkalisoli]
MDRIGKHIASLFKLSEEQVSIFLSAFSREELKKNDVFMEEGKICNKVGLIESGLMKCVFHKHGDEIIFEFAFENNFISDYYSFVTDTPSAKEIKCIEDTTVYVITKDRLNKLGRSHPFIEGISRQMNEKLFLRMHDRLKSFLLDTASERYMKLMSERSDLVQRIPQYLIASYLNVKPETISRIRKKNTL